MPAPRYRVVRHSTLSAILVTLAAGVVASSPTFAGAQERDADDRRDRRERVRHGIAIGDQRYVDGIRINFRDFDMERVRGINITAWWPHDDARESTVTGLAIGLPGTGAGDILGVAIAPLGISAQHDIRGLTVAGIGAGTGGSLSGISLAGIGFGAGRDVRGFTAALIGVGAGGSARGITLGGIGAGIGGEARGLIAGGIGVGGGGSVRGAALGGVGVGLGGDIRGLAFGGVGVGVGGHTRGITVGGIGVGVGGSVSGLTVAGIAVGSPRLNGTVIAPIVGTEDSRAFVVAPLLFRTERGGSARGTNVSALNYVRGRQSGLALGIVNYARTMRSGVQVGLVNIISENPSARRVLPIVNYGAR